MTSPDARLDRSISIHALREEGDFGIRPERQRVNLFLSTPSARRTTTSSKNKRTNDKNFYPRPPRGGRPSCLPGSDPAKRISIHALREEGDCSGSCSGICKSDFYPRPPRGGRPVEALLHIVRQQFLSTPSARRATLSPFAAPEIIRQFLSTPSARRATGVGKRHVGRINISIHALREEGDATFPRST